MSLVFSPVPALPPLFVVAFALMSFLGSYRHALKQTRGDLHLTSVVIHGLCGSLPMLGIAASYSVLVMLMQDLSTHVFFLSGVFILSCFFTFRAWFREIPRRVIQIFIERFVRSSLFIAAGLAIAIALMVGGILCLESYRFFQVIPPNAFYFGLEWHPQMVDAAGKMSAFGIVPLLVGTFIIAGIAILIAGPLGLFSAIYLSHYASKRIRTVLKPALEILAGIPTVVYGFFAIHAIIPVLQDLGERLGLEIAAESALGVGVVMGIMIVPYIAALSEDVLISIASSLRLGALALGATLSECLKAVILPAAAPGLIAAFLLAISRAIGETMLVVMAAGYSAHLTANPFQSMSTVTAQIVSLLTGDQEFDSPQTLAAFALGLSLFMMTLLLNAIALFITRFYQKKYASL